MPQRPDPNQGPSDLDATDLAAVRRAMLGLRTTPAAAPAIAPGQFQPQFPDLESWVNGFFVLTFTRPSPARRWCSHWWDHPEAVLRLEALWRTWEAAALDPVRGMATWIRDHLDPNLAVLFSQTGPFAACDAERHAASAVLPVAATPPDWWSAPQYWWDVLAEDDR